MGPQPVSIKFNGLLNLSLMLLPFYYVPSSYNVSLEMGEPE